MKSTYKLLILFFGLFPFVFSHPAMAGPGPDGLVDGLVYRERVSDDPGDLIHPLRVLGMSLGCTSWMSYSHDGLKANAVADPELEEEVCALIDILPVDYKDSFMIFDYGMYPPLVYLDRGAAHDSAFAWMEAKVKNQYDVRNFLLIGKQINPEDRTVEFRVKLKLPRTGPFGGMNSVLENGFKQNVLNKLEFVFDSLVTKHDKSTAINSLAFIENEGIVELRKLLEGLLGQTISLELDDELLFSNGFFPVPGLPSNIDTTGQPLLNGNLFDFSGLRINEGNGFHPVRENLSQVLNALDWSSFAILTDDGNYYDNNGAGFESANGEFNAAQEKIVLWFHYHISSNSTLPPQVFLKLKNNFTPEEADSLAQKYWRAYLLLFSSGGGSEPPELRNPCPDWPVVDILSWRTNGLGGDNLLNCVEDYFYPIFYGLEYPGGLGCGIVDGVLDNVSFLAELAYGIIDFGRYGHIVNPYPGGFTLLWQADIVYRAIKKEVIEKGWFKFWNWDLDFDSAEEEHMEEGIQYWSNIYSIYESISQEGFVQQMLLSLKLQITEWFGNVSGVNGTRLAAYEHGKIIFEILMDFVSGGASAAKTITKVAKENIGDLINALGKGQYTGFFDQKWLDIQSGVKGAICKILAIGCFLEGTPVLVAGQFGPSDIPIQNVRIFESVLSHTRLVREEGLTASAGNTFFGSLQFDAFVSDQQRQRDQFKVDESGWFEVGFQEITGDSYCKLALHKEWMAQNGINEPGGIHFFDLPEQGISGEFIITSISPIPPYQRPKDENPNDNYEYQPVTGIFVHTSNNVWMVRFDNGDSLGVTYNHPIYSITFRNWRLACELETGERVLARNGAVAVTSKTKVEGTFKVFNLEVREFHNFSVGRSGVLAHNSCINEIEDFIRKKSGNPNWKIRIPGGGLKEGAKFGCNRCVKYAEYNGYTVYFDKNHFPVFEEFAGKGNLNNQVIKYESPNLVGYIEGVPNYTDFNAANNWLTLIQQIYGNNIQIVEPKVKINGVLHTWHHHQDGKTMFLVPSDIHNIPHTGGAAIIKYGLKGVLEGPEF
jgi:hypothetical protein